MLSNAYSKFSITYYKPNGIISIYSCLIFADINNKYYGLGFNQNVNSTEVLEFGPTIDRKNEDSFFICKNIITLNHVIKWDFYSVDSAKKIICRLLKIKAFS